MFRGGRIQVNIKTIAVIGLVLTRAEIAAEIGVSA